VSTLGRSRIRKNPSASCSSIPTRTAWQRGLRIPRRRSSGWKWSLPPSCRTDIAATEFPDPIRQELQTYVSENPGKLILDQHGSILPASAQSAYWDIMSQFTTQPNVDTTIADVAKMMETYDVGNASAWYSWP
jgi:hypothetical protein